MKGGTENGEQKTQKNQSKDGFRNIAVLRISQNSLKKVIGKHLAQAFLFLQKFYTRGWGEIWFNQLKQFRVNTAV